MIQNNIIVINWTRVILILILVLTVFTSINEFPYPVISISPIYRGLLISAILIIGIVFTSNNRSSLLNFDLIEVLLLLRIIYYGVIVFFYSSSDYLLNYLAVVICFLAYSWSTNASIEKRFFISWIEFFIIILELQTIIAAIQAHSSGVELYLIKTNIVTPIGASNFITTFIVMMFPFVYKWETNKLIKNIILILSLVFMFMSRSNSGLIAFAIMLIVIMAIEKRYRILKVAGALSLSSIIVYIIDSKYTGYLSRFINTIRPILTGDIFGDFSATNGRYELYGNLIHLIRERPIFGYGFNYRSLIINELSAHNWILESLVTGGVISLAIYFFCFFYYIESLCKSEKMESHDKQAFLLSLVFVLLQGLIETSLGSLVFDVVFWIILGQGIRYSKIAYSKKGFA